MSNEDQAESNDGRTVSVICISDLVNPEHFPVFASPFPQDVKAATVEAFPSKFVDPDAEGSTEPTAEEIEALTAAIEYAAFEEAANYAQALEDEAAATAKAAETAEAKTTGKTSRGGKA